MAILRKRVSGNFTVIDNGIFRDGELSMKARGLLCTMLSLPDSWEFSERGLGALFPDGQCSLRTAIRELTELGYLTRERVRDGGRIVGWEWTVSDHREFTSKTETEDDEPADEDGSPELDFLNSENSNSENSNSENQHQLNTKGSKTKGSKTKGEGKLTNTRAREPKPETEAEGTFIDALSEAMAYEPTAISREDSERVTMTLLDRMDPGGRVDLATQEAFSRRAIDELARYSGSDADGVLGAAMRLLDGNPRLRRKTPSYLLLDCRAELMRILERDDEGVSWSKW